MSRSLARMTLSLVVAAAGDRSTVFACHLSSCSAGDRASCQAEPQCHGISDSYVRIDNRRTGAHIVRRHANVTVPMTRRLAMTTPTRTLSRALAEIVTDLELEQPTLVDLADLAALAARHGIRTRARELARRLRERGWLLSTSRPGGVRVRTRCPCRPLRSW